MAILLSLVPCSESGGTRQNVLRALLDSVDFIRNPANKPEVLKSLMKGIRLARTEDAEEGYRRVVGLYEKKIYPSVDGIRNGIRLLGVSNEKVRRLKAEQTIDHPDTVPFGRLCAPLLELPAAVEPVDLHWVAAKECRTVIRGLIEE